MPGKKIEIPNSHQPLDPALCQNGFVRNVVLCTNGEHTKQQFSLQVQGANQVSTQIIS